MSVPGSTARTVLGPIEADQLGPTLMHEHLNSLMPGNWLSGGRDMDRADVAVRALKPACDDGITTVVDVTAVTIGRTRERDVRVLEKISKELRIHVVASSAFYKDPWLPPWVLEADIDEIVAFHVREAREGIDGTDIKAGIYGEVGSSLHQITPNEEKCLRAVARAHRETGLPISTHCTLGTMGAEQLALFISEGVDLGRVVLGHLDLVADIDYLLAILASGVTIAFDTIGKQRFDYVMPNPRESGEGEVVKWTFYRPDEERLSNLVNLLSRGYTSQIVLSLDLTGRETYLNEDTIGEYGYSYLNRAFLPLLKECGIGGDAVEQMLVKTPARILGVTRSPKEVLRGYPCNV